MEAASTHWGAMMGQGHWAQTEMPFKHGKMVFMATITSIRTGYSEVVDSQTTEIFKTWLDMVLSNLLQVIPAWLWMICRGAFHKLLHSRNP